MATSSSPTTTERARSVGTAVRLLARALATGRPLDEVAPRVLDALAGELGAGVELVVGPRRWAAGRHADDAAPVPVDGDRIVLRVPGSRVADETVATCADLLTAMAERDAQRQHPTGRQPLVEIARELQRSREQLRQLLDIAPVGIMFVDLDGTLTYANTAAHRILGVPADTLSGRFHEDPRFEIRTLDGAPIPAERRIVPYVLRTGRAVHESQCRVACADGSEVVASVNASPLRSPEGELAGVVVAYSDVTGLDRARQASRHLAALVESADHAIYSVDLDGRIHSWNRGAERLFGWPAEEAVGADVRALLPPDVDEPDTSGVADGLHYTFPTIRRRHDGTDVDVSVTVSPIVETDGRVVGASVLASDISEQVTAQRALAVSEQRFRELAERSEDIIYLMRVRPDGGVWMEYMNPAGERMTGVPADLLARSPDEFVRRVHPDDVARVAAGKVDGLAGPETVTFRFRHADGHWIFLERTRLPITDHRGRVVAVHGIVRDVSRREATERALREALAREERAVHELHALDQLKSSFLQAVSHELRTPLTAVVGLAHTVEDHLDRLPPAQLRELTGRLRANAERLERLLADLLDLERLTRGEFELERRETDLVALVRDVLSVVDTTDHPVTADLAAVTASVEPRLLERIVENLLRNAVKHTPPGTRIVVRLRQEPGAALLEVEDDGPGVPEELWERIFDPFEQGPGSHRAASPGTGIGLSLVQRFAQLHGGEAWVRRSPLGGASFGVRLPASG